MPSNPHITSRPLSPSWRVRRSDRELSKRISCQLWPGLGGEGRRRANRTQRILSTVLQRLIPRSAAKEKKKVKSASCAPKGEDKDDLTHTRIELKGKSEHELIKRGRRSGSLQYKKHTTKE